MGRPGRADLKMVMSWAGPGRVFRSVGRAEPGRETRKCDGPGRAAPHEMWAIHMPLRPAHEAAPVFSRAGFHGPVRAAAHEMWCTTAATTTMSILLMRRPTCFHGPARVAAHELWCTTLLLCTSTTTVLLRRRPPCP